jgi:DNA-binding MarR family transcriptional regulator
VLNTLERDGLVARKRESADRRVVTVELTPAGQVVVSKTTSEHQARELEWTRIFTDRERVTLARLLGKLVRHHPG